MEPNAILEAAMLLPESERLALASRLLESVPPNEATMSLDDPTLLEELDRRFADRDGAIPWTELQAEA